MSIINITEQEFTEGNIGVQHRKITFFGISIYEKRGTTTNSNIVRQLTLITPKDTESPNDGKIKAKMGFNVSD